MDCVDEFPNMFLACGANGSVSLGSLPLFERQVMYAVHATLKIQREKLKSLEVKK
jgi:hypothetical protein